MNIARSAQLAVICAAVAVSSIAGPAQKSAADADWRLLGGDSEAQHYSPLAKINENTVQSLGLAWFADMPTLDGLVGNPLVADNVVYQSGAFATIYANDLRTGELLWQFSPMLRPGDDDVQLWAQRFNRGLALWKDKVIVGTGDCRLIAVDRHSGKPIWDVKSCNAADKLTGITGAPRVGGGKVFIGNACGDVGIARGFVDAFDADTGARKWRFYTVPSHVSAKNSTEIMKRAAASWGTNGLEKTKGCGSAWDAMTYDPILNLLYIGVDGPAPWNPKERAADAGDELFTTAIVAVNADTGAYVWHYTTTPHDAWNFDATMHIMVADLNIDGIKRRVVMQAPKNGFFYVLDAKTGTLLRANNFARVNWASRIDMKTGRPVELPDAKYYDKPDGRAIVFPGPGGAHNWYAMSYNPKAGLVYIPSQEIPTLVTVVPPTESGEQALGMGNILFDLLYGLHDPKYRDQLYGELIGWDPVANKARWRARHVLPINGGTLSTAGNLVFQGTGDGQFIAYSATEGKQLWSWQGDGSIQSAPTTVNLDGQQLILAASGNSASANLSTYSAALTSTVNTRGPSRLLAFKLGGTVKLPDSARQPPFAQPPRPRAAQELAHHGAVLFELNGCVACHGQDAIAAGGSIPDLRRITDTTHRILREIVIGGLYKPMGMPQFADMSIESLAAIEAYLTNSAWDAYEAQDRKTRAQP
jgi:PQQ-dependent dehydrogenase (methanol/ethanol family)